MSEKKIYCPDEFNARLKREKKRYANLRKNFSKAREHLEIRTKIAGIFLAIPDENIYGEVLNVVLEIMESKYGVFGYIDQEGSFICPSLTKEAWDICQMKEKTVVYPRSLWSGIWGRALIEKKAFYSNKSSLTPKGHIPILRSIAAPIIYQKNLLGLLLIANKTSPYTARDKHKLETIAGIIAPILSIRLQRDKEERERKAAKEQLRRIRDELEIRVKERTEQYTRLNEELIEDIENRKRAEEALKISEERFRTLFEKATDGIIIANPQTRKFLLPNQQMCELLGYSRSELQNLGIDDIHPQNSLPYIVEFFKKQASGEMSVARNIPVLRKDKAVIFCDISVGWAYFEGSIHVVGFFRETTERKKAEENLKRNAEIQALLNDILSLSIKNYSLQEMLELILYKIVSIPWLSPEAKGAIFLIEDNSRTLVLKANRGLDEHLCKRVNLGACLCGRAASTKQIQITGCVDENHTIRSHNMKPHGHYCVPVISSDKVLGVINLYNRDGSLYNQEKEEILRAVSNILAGIIERKQTEEALKQSEERFRTIFERAGTGIILVNVEGYPIDCNPSAEKILGYNKDQLRRMNFIEFTHPDDVEMSLRYFNEILTGAVDFYELKNRYIRQDGRITWNNLVVSILNERENSPVLVVLLENIDELKKNEEQLKKIMADLERSNKELEQFVSIASHDLREPLRMVCGYLQLLERRYREKLDKDAGEFIDFAVNGAHRMQALIDDLLIYSKVEICSGPFNEIDSESVLRQVLSDLKTAVLESGASITYDPLPKIFADSLQLAQLFQNLIGNSLKFHKKGNVPQIHISARHDQKNWIFSVKDNGIGINPKFHNEIFKMFRRLHSRFEYEGTGIGLAICKKIIGHHGGDIWLESELGKGTVFYFTIPKKRGVRQE